VTDGATWLELAAGGMDLLGVAAGSWYVASRYRERVLADSDHKLLILGESTSTPGSLTASVPDPRSAAGDDPLGAWRAARADMMAALDPAALARPVPQPWGESISLSGFLERYPVEFLVHTWDLAQATRQSAELDPDLVRDALEPARQFAPMARRFGLIGPECAVAEDADDLTRLLAILGRRSADG
jgi:uncharacterized protein (TIGR03086 family)